MSLQLYCICAVPDLAGGAVPRPADDRPGLRWLDTDALSALVGPVPVRDDVAAMLAFGRVIAHYHGHFTIVPMRYGSCLPGPDAVLDHLRADRRRYETLLAALHDCVEMGLRLPLPAGAPAADPGGEPVSGRDYLLRRRVELADTLRVEAALDELDRELAGLFRQRHREQGWFAGEQRLSVQYLVPRAHLCEFRRRLAGALSALSCTDASESALTS
ncbi:MAG: GvpL/GvpF family gas vesicle protein, partial [Thiohalocapsa sp.]|nr:GvpL/GvpF family gas vesicle protein [Thiohalocapsa sp.]